MSQLKLHRPFDISARLMPALRIADAHETAWLHYDLDNRQFILDLPDGYEHKIEGYSPGAASKLEDQFEAILGFLSACGDAYRYSMAHPDSKPENLDLFPPPVAEWAYRFYDELVALELDIQEADRTLLEFSR